MKLATAVTLILATILISGCGSSNRGGGSGGSSGSISSVVGGITGADMSLELTQAEMRFSDYVRKHPDWIIKCIDSQGRAYKNKYLECAVYPVGIPPKVKAMFASADRRANAKLCLSYIVDNPRTQYIREPLCDDLWRLADTLRVQTSVGRNPNNGFLTEYQRRLLRH